MGKLDDFEELNLITKISRLLDRAGAYDKKIEMAMKVRSDRQPDDGISRHSNKNSNREGDNQSHPIQREPDQP